MYSGKHERISKKNSVNLCTGFATKQSRPREVRQAETP